MAYFKLFLGLSFLLVLVNGYGYKYYYNPYTQEVQLWSLVPGQTAPTVTNNFLRDDPGSYQYRDASTGEYKWNCKYDAYYSDYLKRCVWTRAYFSRKG